MNQSQQTRQTSTNVEKTQAAPARRLSPAVDIFENADGFLLVADVPGVEPSALTLEYEPPELHIAGHTGENGSVVYERRFELGSGVDPGTINAELKNGVLRIDLKKSAALRSRKIEVRSA
jgi:HSP20 family molecular chaperone IbpA